MNSHNDTILGKVKDENSVFIDLAGICVAILYSKEIFKRNKDINFFLKEVFNIEFLPYVMKSRTLIVARVTRELKKKNKEELIQIQKNVIQYFVQDNNRDVKSSNKKGYKKKNENDKMKAWLESL